MSYTVTADAIADVLILEPKVFGKDRGFFFGAGLQVVHGPGCEFWAE